MDVFSLMKDGLLEIEWQRHEIPLNNVVNSLGSF